MGTGKVANRLVGGSAAERGLDFQARVSAIVMAHLLAERPVGWLEGVLNDTPLELDAETGGPGDDIRFVSKCGKSVELQAKRGLQRGDRLWSALLALAKGISDGSIHSGVLAVCPNSSGTIREALAEDIVRLGAGRFDGLREISQEWARQLVAASLDVGFVCQHLRIVVVSAVDGNRESETTATERLNRVTPDPLLAWPVLVNCGRILIRRRGRTTSENIYRDLSLANVALKTSDIGTRVQLLAATREWLHSTHANMNLLGVRGTVPFEACWLELDVHVMNDVLFEQEELDKALRRYHEYGRRQGYGGKSFQSQTIGRFIKKCVVLGGPGIGKSTLLKKLALDYSIDGFLALLVRLPQVVALVTREGRRFEDSLLEVALSSSGIRAPLVSLEGAVLLCDALDECGNQQPLVTAALHAFSVAHPRTRIVVTSRPIGYRPGELAAWRHYELQPLNESAVEQALLQVLKAIPFANEALLSKAIVFAKDTLRARSIKDAAARSPLMITLLAALSARGIDPGLDKASLYRQLFKLLEDNPTPRLAERSPSEPERSRFLELLGWCLLCHGNETAEQTLSRCARRWREETGQPSLISEAKVDACLEYWENLGVVERVRTLTQEAITFVHKTFGEFAAGRDMVKSDATAQRDAVVRAIRTPEWKEALSFASDLGLAPRVLQVWIELAELGDTRASHRLDDALQLVAHTRVLVADETLASFANCCWHAVENTASRTRYAAGNALCRMSQDHWDVIRKMVLARLECADPWSRFVAWACMCVSPERDLTVRTLIDTLHSLDFAPLMESSLDGRFNLQPTGSAVRQQLIRGAARRILNSNPEPEALELLNGLIGNAQSLSGCTKSELRDLFQQVGVTPDVSLEENWSAAMSPLIPTRDEWNREHYYLIDLIDDSSTVNEDENSGDIRGLELAALLTATSFWDMPIWDTLDTSASALINARRRMVMQVVARSAGISYPSVVRQAQTLKRRIHDSNSNEKPVLFTLPDVDVDVDFDQPLVDVGFIPELEGLILGESHFFAIIATELLYGMREKFGYAEAIERLLSGGRGESLRLSAFLAKSLPNWVGQQLLLNRLCLGDITDGCRHLYVELTPPFEARHVEAVRKGLEGLSPRAAVAAAELASKLPMDDTLAGAWRICFEQWKVREKAYPKNDDTCQVSPREQLSKILSQFFAHDHSFLIELLTDDRSDVKTAAEKPVLAAAALSQTLRTRLFDDVKSGRLGSAILRAAVSQGLYIGEEAMLVMQLLHNREARIRYAALPILDARFSSVEVMRAEATRLLVDPAMDIREEASRVLRSLESETGAGR